jgi:quinol-cytochrome oxidoreductase complex cytochrome b subunit
MLLFVVLTFGATGYLLPWDQWAYWTVTEVLDAISATLLVGGLVTEAIKGDVIVSGATLSRFFALHVIVLPWIAFALLGYHFTLVRRRGVAPPAAVEETEDPWRPSAALTLEEIEKMDSGVPFFPHHLLRILVVTVLVIAVAITLAVLFPRPMADAASPYQLPDELVSTWVPVDVSLALIRYLGPWGFTGFTLLGLAMALLPLFDRSPERRLRHRPVAAVLGVTFFVAFAAAWIVGRQLRDVAPSERLPEVPSAVSDSMPPGVPLPELGPTPQRPGDPDAERSRP